MTNNLIEKETVKGFSLFDYLFILVGMIIQAVVFTVTGSSKLSLISGLFGVASVVLCSSRKLMFYILGFIQLITYIILAGRQNLYGEIVENVFYFVTMLYGIYHWSRNYNDNTQEVNTRGMTIPQSLFVAGITYFGVIVLYNILNRTNDTQPFMDAITTVPAFVAQILMILRYKESWFYWLIIDLGSIVMWAVAGDWCMVAQFIFWTLNCIYGLYKWNKV